MTEPRYCTRCGALLGRSRLRMTGYDELTGCAIYEADIKCPNYRWWNLWHTKVAASYS